MKCLIILSVLQFFLISSIIAGDEFEDYRCRCVCPSLTVLQDSPVNDTHRRVYIDVVPPEQCNCNRVVFSQISASEDFQSKFCLRCSCNYEVRNTTTMKVVVIIIMVSISLLFIYMAFLLCLDPIMNPSAKAPAPRPTKSYQRQINDDVQVENPTQECLFSEPTSLQQGRQRSSAVLNLMTHEQSKWRRQVQQQRQSVYNRHDLLN